MSPARSSRHTPYRPPRDRREVFTAVLGVVLVLAFTVAMVWVLAPEEKSAPSTPGVTIPTSTPTDSTTGSTPTDSTVTTVPGDTTPTTAPAG